MSFKSIDKVRATVWCGNLYADVTSESDKLLELLIQVSILAHSHLGSRTLNGNISSLNSFTFNSSATGGSDLDEFL